MSRSSRFVQPDFVVVSRSGNDTLLPNDAIDEGRRRVAAGEDPEKVALELAQMEVELLYPDLDDLEEEFRRETGYRGAEFNSDQPRDEQGQWTDTGGDAGRLSSEERHEIARMYTQSGGTYREVNSGLREGQDMSSHQTVQVLDGLFKTDAEPVTDVLYRGLAGYDPYELNLDVGVEFTDKGFVSTATSRSAANRFATHGESDKGKLEGEAVGIVFKINGKGTPALNMTRYSRYGEDERLLNRGTTFRVTHMKIGEPGKSVSVVTLKVVQK